MSNEHEREEPTSPALQKNVGEWLRWGIVALVAAANLYFRSTFLTKEEFHRERDEAAKIYSAQLSVSTQKSESFISALAEITATLRAVQADKTPSVLSERLRTLETELKQLERAFSRLEGRLDRQEK